MKRKIFIIAGEKSGDLLGSKIIKGLNKDKFEIAGIGGEMMEKEGLKSFFSINEISVMGVFEVLPKLFKILKIIKTTANHIVESKQDILLTIDAPDFSFRVAKLVKKLDAKKEIKLVHFIAPSVWVYRKKRASAIAKIYDLLFCILPFEPPYFEKYGLKTIFVGHPIFDKNSSEYVFNNKNIEYNPDNKIIAITTGSRNSEVKILLPIVLEVVEKLKEKYENLEYHILSTDNTLDTINSILKKHNVDYIKIDRTPEEKDKTLDNTLLSLAKSGTNALEIAGYGVPMVVFYRFNFLTNFIARLIRYTNKVKYVNLINIINEKSNREAIIPEVVLNKCIPENIYKKTCELLNNEELRKKQVKSNLDTIKILGYNSEEDSIENIINNLNELC